MINNDYAFEQMRPLQVDIIDRIIAAFEDKKYVLLEAPTGIGKSGIVMSIALHLKNSYINTSSKLLQDQYLRDFPFIKTVKGKSNFDCIYDAQDITCEKGHCNFSSTFICPNKPAFEDYDCNNRGTKQEFIYYNHKTKEFYNKEGKKETTSPIENRCKYYEQKMVGLTSGHTIMNYSYFFSLFFYTDDLVKRNLLVFDEAHNIENQIIDFVSLYPRPNYYEKFHRQLEDYLRNNIKLPQYPINDDFNLWLRYLKDTYTWMSEVINYYEDEKGPDFLSDLKTANKKLGHVTSLMEQHRENWVIDIKTEVGGKISSVKISPIETGPYVKPIFEMGDKVLLTSATILDKDVFCGMVGINPQEVEFIRIDESPFPKENRLIHLKNTGDMNYKTMESLMPKIVSEIDSVLQKHVNERGIIHTTSYKQLEYILKNSRYKNRLIKTETGVSQSEALRKAAFKKDAVLISPSMHEGVDLKDDLSRFQITVKIPFLDLSDKRTVIKMRKSPSWYQYYAILKLIQGIGRSIRNENDHAVTYILDSKAGYVLHNLMTPQYVRDAIIR